MGKRVTSVNVSGENRATAQPRNSAGNSFTPNPSPSAAAGLHATAPRPHSTIAGGQTMTARVLSAISWFPSTPEGVHASRPARWPMERCGEHTGGWITIWQSNPENKEAFSKLRSSRGNELKLYGFLRIWSLLTSAATVLKEALNKTKSNKQ